MGKKIFKKKKNRARGALGTLAKCGGVGPHCQFSRAADDGEICGPMSCSFYRHS